MKLRNSFVSTFFSMASLLILAKLFGFIKNLLIANNYGAGFISDIYSFEDGLINQLYAVFSAFMACTFIPTYVSLKEDERNKVTNIILTIGSISVFMITIISMFFTRSLLKILVPGFFILYDIDSIILITRVYLLNLIGAYLINFFVTLLHANEMYAYLTLESLLSGVLFIIYLLFFSSYGIWGLLFTKITSTCIVFIILGCVHINMIK